MAQPHIRIFPHSQSEFPSEDDLTMWLLTSLRARGGVYHLRSADAVKDLPPGSVVLFRYGHDIVGEGVIWKGKEVFAEPLKERMPSGVAEMYGAQVTFAPASIRLYAPPLHVEKIQPFTDKGIVKFAGAYVELEWSVYPHILEQVVSSGTFIS